MGGAAFLTAGAEPILAGPGHLSGLLDRIVRSRRASASSRLGPKALSGNGATGTVAPTIRHVNGSAGVEPFQTVTWTPNGRHPPGVEEDVAELQTGASEPEPRAEAEPEAQLEPEAQPEPDHELSPE